MAEAQPPGSDTSASNATIIPASNTSNVKAANAVLSFEEFLASFGGANLSDEEVAIKLQEYYEMADQQQQATVVQPKNDKPDVDDPELLKMMDEDEKLAKMLQAELYNEVSKPAAPAPSPSYTAFVNSNYYGAPAPPLAPAPAPSSTSAPILLTPQTASSLLKSTGSLNTTSPTTTTTTSTTSTTTTTAESSIAPSSQPTIADVDTTDADDPNEIVCLICHDSEFDEYVVLPACEHKFCVDCASRMTTGAATHQNSSYGYGAGRRTKRGATQQSGTVQCAMCETVTELDPALGIDGLKRRTKKRKAGNEPSQGVCAQHAQPIQFYCFDHREAVCFGCIQLGGPHNGHKYDALDSAVASLKAESVKKLAALDAKRNKLVQFKSEVEAHRAKIAASGEQRIHELHDSMAKVRKLLEKKEKDLEVEIKRMVDRKNTTTQQELRWAEEKMTLLNSTITGVGALLDESGKKDAQQPESCLRFLAGMSDYDERLADSVSLPLKQVNQDQYSFPALTGLLSIAQRTINSLKYTEALRHAPGTYGLSGEEDEYYDDDDDSVEAE